ncbi:MAG: hypothetical protein JO359_00420 [Candidatus Eremiobacteraeota bacterium]|nr:hypothetical protein [Candidatus Eremiobacteraeota bacterium]
MKKAASASLALAAMAALLAGCSGGGTQSVMPKSASPGSGPAPVSATGQSLIVKNTLDLHKMTIPATATTVTVFVIQSPASALAPQYFPVATCVNIPVPGSGVGPAAIPFAAPVGIDYVVIASSTGPCTQATSSTTLPAAVNTAVQTAIANGGFALNGSITAATLPTTTVAGTIGTGTWLTLQGNGIAGNPFTVNPGGGIATGAQVLGYPLTVPQSITGASLSTSTPNITTFEMDAAGVYGLPFNITVNGAGGATPASGASCNPITGAGACNNFDVPVTVTLTNASSGAASGTVSLALVTSTGAVLANTAANLGAFGCAPTVACAAITIGSALPAGATFVVLYNGAGQDVFQKATVTATYNGSTLATLTVTNQPQVQTIVTAGAGGTPPGGGFVGPLGLDLGFGTAAQSVAYIANNGPNLAFPGGCPANGGGCVVADSALTPFGANTATVTASNSPAVAGTLFSSVATNHVAASNIWAADANCINCSGAAGGAYAFYTLANGFAAAAVPAVVGTAATVQPPFQATVLPPFKPGVVGMVFVPPAIAGVSDAATCQPAGCGSGVIFFAANNSIYRAELSAVNTVSYYRLIAGTGTAGALGQGNVDSTSGIGAKFNFGTANFVGMTADFNTANTTVANLYVVDVGNGTVRKVSLTGTNGTATVISAAAARGITYDTRSKLLYVTNSDNTVAAVTTAGVASPFAGAAGVAGTSNGLGQVAYPVQFNAGNAVAAAAGGPPAAGTTFSGLGLGPNSNAAAQLAAGVGSYVGRFNSPFGIAYDVATNAYFWVVDNATPALRVVF